MSLLSVIIAVFIPWRKNICYFPLIIYISSSHFLGVILHYNEAWLFLIHFAILFSEVWCSRVCSHPPNFPFLHQPTLLLSLICSSVWAMLSLVWFSCERKCRDVQGAPTFCLVCEQMWKGKLRIIFYNALTCGCPTSWLTWSALSEQEFSWATYTRIAPKVMPSVNFHRNYNWYKEHNNNIWWRKISATTHCFFPLSSPLTVHFHQQ